MPLFNHPRAKKLIAETIDRLELSLAGLHIFTEAASNNFVVTPIIAAMAGAESVAAIARDSAYGSFKQIREETLQLAEYCGISSRLEVVSHKEQALLDRADIVTNLGFVRPLDADTIAMIKPGAVIPLMFEKWESRPGEIDLELCRRKNISVVATNEDQSLVNVFNYMGSLALKMVLDGAIELYKSRLAVIGRDKFAKAVHSLLSAMGLHIEHFSSLNGVMERAMLGSLDALIIADYVSQELIIGAGGQIEAEELARGLGQGPRAAPGPPPGLGGPGAPRAPGNRRSHSASPALPTDGPPRSGHEPAKTPTPRRTRGLG